MPTMADEQVIPLREAASRFGVSETTIRYWMDRGELRKHQSGNRRVFVDADELRRLLEAKRNPRPADDGGE